MLLRRITEHVRTQNWTAVALDFFIVVMGVFIGIQVSNWNESLKQRDREQQYLERLDAEMDTIRQRAAGGADAFKQSIDSIDLLLRLLRQYENDPNTQLPGDEAIAEAIGSITRGRVPAESPAAFKEMVANGALETLSSAELRQALFAFDEFASVARAGWLTLRDEGHAAANAMGSLVDVAASADEFDFDGADGVDFVRLRRKKFFEDPESSGHLSILIGTQINQRGLALRQLELAETVEAIIAEERAK